MIKLEDISTNRGERNFSQSFNEFGIDVSRNEILPGHYYSLNVPVANLNPMWVPGSTDEFKENPKAFITDKEYYDMNPVGLVFHHPDWKKNALILNLKVIPPKYRTNIIVAHVNLIEKSLDRINALPWSKDKPVEFRERTKLGLPLFRVTPSILQQLTGFKLGYAISGIKMDKIIQAKVLDWDNIGELPLANIDQRGLVVSPSLSGLDSIFNNFENKQMI
jgi:hypothetical protein